MNYARNNEIIRKHFHDHQEHLCISVLLNIPHFFDEFFLFSKLSGIVRDFCRKFHDYSGIYHNYNFPGLFKGMMPFQGLFKACANYATNIKFDANS